MYENLIKRKDSEGKCGCIGICRSNRWRDKKNHSYTEVYTNDMDGGGPKLRQKSKFKVKHQKRKLFRANEPFFSVFMWGVNYSVVEVSHANVPVMLLPDDFKAFMKIKVDLQYFNQDIMPSHYKFKVYCPLVFKAFRDIFQISDRQWKYSLTTKQLVSMKNREKMWISHDRKFLVRCVTGEDVDNLHGILPDLHKHYIETRGRTLLPMFVGLFRLMVDDKNIYLLVSKHIFDTSLPIHEMYSIKGSTVDRNASEKDLMLDPPLLKDNDLITNKRQIHVGHETKQVLLNRLRQDTKFLTSLNIMDYSLIVGIHDCSAPINSVVETTQKSQVQIRIRSSEISDFPRRPNDQVDDENVITVGHDDEHHYSLNDDSEFDADENIQSSFDFHSLVQDNDSISRHDSVSEKKEIYFIGLIDILTFYGTRKKTYHLAKTAKYGSVADISNVKPGQYANRMLDFLDRIFV